MAGSVSPILAPHRRHNALDNLRVDGMSQQMIADRHAVSRDWVSKTIREFPQRLAVAILNTPVGEHEKSA